MAAGYFMAPGDRPPAQHKMYKIIWMLTSNYVIARYERGKTRYMQVAPCLSSRDIVQAEIALVRMTLNSNQLHIPIFNKTETG